MTSKAEKVAHVRREIRKGQSRHHECHARGCTKQVPPAFFMCAAHWRMVPRRLQLLVWQHYNAGQEKGDADVTEEYLRVTDEAIEAVAAAESA